jgi:hypothetical protein
MAVSRKSIGQPGWIRVDLDNAGRSIRRAAERVSLETSKNPNLLRSRLRAASNAVERAMKLVK